KAKEFTQAFLDQKPITLTDCGRDKYFRLLCDVTNADGEDLATELIRRDLGDPYNGGTKSTRYR
ncbi:MAG: thermonuclease family protein, partial [Elusimicrobia bacterium]|nr:thermonuclease family protein [Elusimicrobiota bacterium]